MNLPALELPAAPRPTLATCDRCGARAQVRYVLLSGLDLAFCGHDAREHGPRLCAKELVIKIEKF